MSQESVRDELAFIQVGMETEIKKKNKNNVLTKNELNVYSKTLVGCLCWSFTALRHILGHFERGQLS